MTALAWLAVALAVGAWLGIRWAEAGRQIDDILATVLATDLPEPSACAACGAADTGARAGLPPLPGAGSTPQHPASAHRQPAWRTPGT